MNTSAGNIKMLYVLGAVGICLILLLNFILPEMDRKTKLVEELDANTVKYEEMKTTVEDSSIEPQYEELKNATKIKFQENFPAYDIDFIIKSVLSAFEVKPESFNASEDYQAITPDVYEQKIIQPRNAEEYQAMQETLASELMPMFLMKKANITIKVEPNQIWPIIDAINNIAPYGPGERVIQRYCLQVGEFSFKLDKEKPNEPQNFELSIFLYAMAPPPIKEDVTPANIDKEAASEVSPTTDEESAA